MGRYDDINPMDMDPDTGRPYSNYSSPALDTSFHDHEMDVGARTAGDIERDLSEIVEAVATGSLWANHKHRFKELEEELAAMGGANDDDEAIELDEEDRCTSPDGVHDWPRVEEHQRCLCTYCGADGDA